MKKKILISSAVAVVVLLIIVGIGAFITRPQKDSDWGIVLKVKDASPTGAKVHMTRQALGKGSELYTGEKYVFERLTLRGWKPVEMTGSLLFLGMAYTVDYDFSKIWNLKWADVYGKLSTGCYRITKFVTVEDYYKDKTGVDRRLELEYYDTFFIVDWWEVAFVGVILVLLLGVVVVLYKRERRARLIAFLIKKKVVLIVLFLSSFALGTGIFLILDYGAAERSQRKYGYKITSIKVTPTNVKGYMEYPNDGDELLQEILTCENDYYIEEKTIGGWKRVVHIEEKHMTAMRVQETFRNGFELTWEEEYGELPPGTYRIRQPFHVYHYKEDVYSEGNLYIVFSVEK